MQLRMVPADITIRWMIREEVMVERFEIRWGRDSRKAIMFIRESRVVYRFIRMKGLRL